MDKGVSGGTVSIKQWDGAFNTLSTVLKCGIRVLLTGGVLTWPYRVDMYQTNNRFVAISTST